MIRYEERDSDDVSSSSSSAYCFVLLLDSTTASGEVDKYQSPESPASNTLKHWPNPTHVGKEMKLNDASDETVDYCYKQIKWIKMVEVDLLKLLKCSLCRATDFGIKTCKK